MRGGKAIDGAPGDLRAGEIQIGDADLQAVIGHGDGVGIEGIGLDDVRAGFEVLRVNLLDDVRLGEVQHVVVEAQIARMMGEFLAAIVGFVQVARLDHRAHGAIEQQDALGASGRVSSSRICSP